MRKRTKDTEELLVDTLEWDAKPAMGMHKMTHKFSIIEAIEKASSALDTDYTCQTETIIAGRIARAVFCALPHLVMTGTNDKGFLPSVDGMAKIGTLANRIVLYDRKMADNLFVLSTGDECVEIIITNANYL